MEIRKYILVDNSWFYININVPYDVKAFRVNDMW
jgi:hypothetical protein